MLRQKARRGSEGPSEGIRRIRRGFPEEEPSATAVCIDEGRGKSDAPVFSQAPFVSCQLINGLQPQIHFPTTGMRRTRIAAADAHAKVAAAVAKIASGVGRCRHNAADTGVRMNMCMR